MPVKDLIGIGIGPFNLSLAAMAKDTEKLNAAFFDANPEFSWHPGMLLPTATMQTYVLQDLVTTVAPRSEFSFINYLVDQKKIYRFLATEQLIISRDEFSDYLRWACDRIAGLHFSEPVERIDFDDKRQEFIVQSEKGEHRARNICLGTGHAPWIPKPARAALGDNCFHAAEIELREPDFTGKRVVVVGGGQSGGRGSGSERSAGDEETARSGGHFHSPQQSAGTSARRDSLLGDQPGAFASARYQRITPMKARRVTQMIHGLPVDDALALLQFAPQSAAKTVYKVLESAIANAETTEDLDRADLVVGSLAAHSAGTPPIAGVLLTLNEVPSDEILTLAARLAPGTPVGAAGVRGAVPGSPPPSHWRQSSAPPAATSTSGHTITSENRRPNARKVNRTLSARNAIPTAISIVPRLVRSHTGVAGASPAGRNTQASR